MTEKNKIHITYIISILIVIIILLLTIQWGHIPELVQLIGFAATITSLVVGLIAIIYSFYANDSFTKTITELSLASKEIKDGSQDLKSKIESIPSSMEKFSSRFDETNELIKKSLSDDNKTQKSPADTPVLDDATIAKFMENIPSTGLEILYFVKKCIDRSKSVDLEKAIKEAEIAGYSYFVAFLYPLSALGVIKFSRLQKVWTFIDMNKYLTANIESFAIEKAKQYDAKHQLEKDSELYEMLSHVRNLQNIDKYFSK